MPSVPGCSGSSSIVGGSTNICAIQALPPPPPADIPATAVTVQTWAPCANGFLVPQRPAACTGDLLSAIEDIRQYLFCVMGAVNVSLSTGACSIMMPNAGKNALVPVQDALQNCLPAANTPPVTVIGRTAGGMPQWLPVPSSIAPFISNCSELQTRLAPGGTCFSQYSSAPTLVFGNGPNGLGYYVPAAGGGGTTSSDYCADARGRNVNQLTAIFGANGTTCGHILPAARTTLYKGLTGEAVFQCLPPDAHCPATRGQIIDPSSNSDDGFRPEYRVPYRAFAYTTASQVTGNSPQTITPNNLTVVNLTLNREEGTDAYTIAANGSQVITPQNSWFSPGSSTFSIAREGWYMISASVYMRTMVTSNSSNPPFASYSAYAGIVSTSALHGSSLYRIGEQTMFADGQTKNVQHSGSTIMHLLPGETVFLRVMVVQAAAGAAGINFSSADLRVWLDGQSHIAIAELPGYKP